MMSNTRPVRPLAQLLQTTRNRLWLHQIFTRLIWGCYLSAGIALVLMAIHLGLTAVPTLLWWIAICLPIAGFATFAILTERPNLTQAASVADVWFATDELLTAAQYATQLSPDQPHTNTLRQLSATADAIAKRLLKNPKGRPALATDPRVTIALLVIALSAFVTLATNPNMPVPQVVIQGAEATQSNSAEGKSWLVVAEPEATQRTLAAASDILIEGTIEGAIENTNNSYAAVGFDKPKLATTAKTSTQPVATNDSVALANQSPQQSGTQASQAPASTTTSATTGMTAGADSTSHPTANNKGAAHASDAIDQTASNSGAKLQARSEADPKLASPAIPTTHHQLQHSSLQISGQANLNSPTKPGHLDTLTASEAQQLQVIKNQTSQLPQVETNDMAQQLLGPVARTLAAGYIESQRP